MKAERTMKAMKIGKTQATIGATAKAKAKAKAARIQESSPAQESALVVHTASTNEDELFEELMRLTKGKPLESLPENDQKHILKAHGYC